MLRFGAVTSRIQRSVPFRTQLHPFIASLGSPLCTQTSNSSLEKDTASTVIIGGGVVGTSLAYHLAKKGQRDVILLEKSELTAGSTWHAAGLTAFFHPMVNPRKLHYYSINFYNNLEKETGLATGLHTPGSIRLLTTPERMDEARFMQSRGYWNQAPQELITAERVAELHPLLNMDGVLGGLYNPGDGHIDPNSITMSMAKGARMHGASIVNPCQVTGLTQMTDGTDRWQVETDRGTITADRVVNTAGFWAKEVGALAGLNLPLITIEHQYVIFDTVPEVASRGRDPANELPVVRDLEYSYYLRQERQGMLLGPYEPKHKMHLRDDWARNGVPPGFGKELFPPNLDKIEDNVLAAMDRVPALANVGIQNVTNGPINYSPDVLPMIGPMPSKKNFWLACGFAYGIVHGGGVGDYLSDWILNGESPYELSEFDPARYGNWTTDAYTAAKARQAYGENNLIYHPHSVRPDGRPARTSPMYHKMLSRGAQMGEHNGWEQPHWFALEGDDDSYKPSFRRTNWHEPVRREVEACTQGVGVSDLTPFSKYEICGPGARAFLDRMGANMLPRVGRANISHLLTPRGRVMAEITISRLSKDKFYIVTGSGVELHDLRWLEDHLPDDGSVTLTNVTPRLAVLGVVGPKSRELMQALTYTDMSDEAFKFFDAKEIDVGPARVLAVRVSYTGELGWELHCPLEQAGPLYDAILKEGEQHGIRDVGGYAIDSLRLEKGFRLWGHEMNMDTGPLEAGLGAFIRTDKKSEFIGKEEMVKQKASPLTRQLCALLVDTDGGGEFAPKAEGPEGYGAVEGGGNIDPTGDEAVWQDGELVGNTTSGGYGFTVGTSIAMAYLPTGLSEPGTVVQVELVGRRYQARVVAEPIVETEPTRNRRAKKEAEKAAAAGAAK